MSRDLAKPMSMQVHSCIVKAYRESIATYVVFDEIESQT